MSGQDILQGPLVLSGTNISIGGQDIQFVTVSPASTENLAIGKSLSFGRQDAAYATASATFHNVELLANNQLIYFQPYWQGPACPYVIFEVRRTDPFTSSLWGENPNWHVLDLRTATVPKDIYDAMSPYMGEFTQLEVTGQSGDSSAWTISFRSTFLPGNGIVSYTYDPTPFTGFTTSNGVIVGGASSSLEIGRNLSVGASASQCIVIGSSESSVSGVGSGEVRSIAIGADVFIGSKIGLYPQDHRDNFALGTRIDLLTIGSCYENVMIGTELHFDGSWLGYNVIIGRYTYLYGSTSQNISICTSGVSFATGSSQNLFLGGNWSFSEGANCNTILCPGGSYYDTVGNAFRFNHNVAIGVCSLGKVEYSLAIMQSEVKSNYGLAIGNNIIGENSNFTVALGPYDTYIGDWCHGTLFFGSYINYGSTSASSPSNVGIGNRITMGSGVDKNIVINASDVDEYLGTPTPSTIAGSPATALFNWPRPSSFVDNDYIVIPKNGTSSLILEFQVTNSYVPAQSGSLTVDLRLVLEGYSWDTWNAVAPVMAADHFKINPEWVTQTEDLLTLRFIHPLPGVLGNLTVENHVASTNFSVTGFSGGENTSRNILIGSENTVGASSNYSVVLGNSHNVGNSSSYGIAIGYDSQIDGGVARAITIGTGVTSNGGGSYTTLVGHSVNGSYGSHHVVGVGSSINTGSGSSYSVFIGDGVTSLNTSGSVYIGKDVTSGGGGANTCIGIGHTLTIAGGTGYAILIGNAITFPQGGNSQNIAIGRTITVNGGSASNIALGIGITFAGDATPTGSHTVIGRTISVAALVDGVIVIGDNVTASYSNGIYIGSGSSLAGTYGIAVGVNASAGPSCVAVGYGASVGTYSGGVALGCNASVTDSSNAIALGNSSVVGSGCHVGIAIGGGSSIAGSTQAIALGSGASIGASGHSGIAIGTSSSLGTNSPVAIALGYTATVTGAAGIAVGSAATVTAPAGIAIGSTATVTGAAGIAVGSAATAGANEMVVGASTESSAIHSFTVKGYNGVAINTLVAIDNPGTDECGISIVYNNGSSVANKVVKGAVSPPSGSILLYVDP